jgi:AcrR family transcriptional regulator
MSPRPKTVDDAAVAAAFARVIAKLGPSRLTLAAIAREAGLSPATLIQRFGSKRQLLVELSKGAGDAGPLVERLRGEGTDPLEIVRAVLLHYASMAPTPEVMINSFGAYLQIDLADPALRRFVVASTKQNLALMAQLLREAEASGAIVCPDPAGTARVLLATTTGSLLHWAASREGKAAVWLARDVDAALAPLICQRRRSKRE